MKHIVRLLFLLCIGISPLAHADDLCQRFLKGNWRESDDPLILSMAKKFLKKIPGTNLIRVCAGYDDPPTFARTEYREFDLGRAIFMGIDSRIRNVADESTVEALVAHEIAHYATGKPVSCYGYILLHQYIPYAECEYRVDAIAARWTNKQAVLASNRVATSFLETLEEPRTLIDIRLLQYRSGLLELQ